MAGIGPGDIDVAEVHDCFTGVELINYEDLGFCEKFGARQADRGAARPTSAGASRSTRAAASRPRAIRPAPPASPSASRSSSSSAASRPTRSTGPRSGWPTTSAARPPSRRSRSSVPSALIRVILTFWSMGSHVRTRGVSHERRRHDPRQRGRPRDRAADDVRRAHPREVQGAGAEGHGGRRRQPVLVVRGTSAPRTWGSTRSPAARPRSTGSTRLRFDQMRPGCYDIHERIRDMNANGVLGSINFPTFVHFCGQLFLRAKRQGPRPRRRARLQRLAHRRVGGHLPRAHHPAVDHAVVGRAS